MRTTYARILGDRGRWSPRNRLWQAEVFNPQQDHRVEDRFYTRLLAYPIFERGTAGAEAACKGGLFRFEAYLI